MSRKLRQLHERSAKDLARQFGAVQLEAPPAQGDLQSLKSFEINMSAELRGSSRSK